MPAQYRGLRAFCAAARSASFKHAADELCLSASAISHQIRDLEAYLGIRLFEREIRSISLTQAGREYFEAIEPLLRGIDLITDSIRRKPERCTVKVQMPEFFASELFVPRIGEFSAQHPDLDLQIESGSTSMSSTPADVQILLSGKQPANPTAQRLFPIRYVPACSSDLYGNSDHGPELLQQATLLVHKARPQAWQRWASMAGLPDPQPERIIRLESMFALARATEQGVGIGLIPMPMSDNWFASGTLKRLFDQDLITTDYYYVCTSGDSENPEATRLLWQWIVNTFTGTNSVHE
jgi:LysR family transcriptional regulator, glycine cleavage system transcriptional activator